MTTSKQKSGPLTGVTVIDLTSVISGPYVTQVLGDFGAEVIKIEPFNGDVTRTLGTQVCKGITMYYCQFNRNKKSISIDLKSQNGKEVFEKLMEKADVLVENFRAGIVESLGISYDQLKCHHPRLIYASIRGFPEDSNFDTVRCYDSMIQALGGFAYAQGTVHEPVFIKNAIADKISGLTCLNGLLSALYMREKTGQGQRVQVSMLEAYFSFMRNHTDQKFIFPDQDINDIVPDAHRCYKLKDGWASFMFLKPEQYHELFRALNRPGLIDDSIAISDFIKNIDAINDIVGELLSDLDIEDVLEISKKHMLPIAPILDREGALKFSRSINCNLTSSRFVAQYDQEYADINSVFKYSKGESGYVSPPPLLGEHTLQILKELGYNDSQVSEMLLNKSILCA